MVPSAFSSLASSRPNGVSSRSRATARVDRFGSNGVMVVSFISVLRSEVRPMSCHCRGYARGPLHGAVFQRRQAGAHVVHEDRVDVAVDHALALRMDGLDLAPRVDQHRMAPGAAAVL